MKRLLIKKISRKYGDVKSFKEGVLEIEFGNMKKDQTFKTAQLLYKQLRALGVKALKFSYCEVELVLDELTKYSIQESWLLGMRQEYDLDIGRCGRTLVCID